MAGDVLSGFPSFWDESAGGGPVPIPVLDGFLVVAGGPKSNGTFDGWDFGACLFGAKKNLEMSDEAVDFL